jgi:GNAT superfamily N-acetyltransferase
VERGDHANRWLRDDHDTTATILTARVSGQLVGTVRLLIGDCVTFGAEEHRTYGLNRLDGLVAPGGIAVVDRFMVVPEHRGGNTAAMLMLSVTQLGLDRGIQVAFCDCEPSIAVLGSCRTGRSSTIRLRVFSFLW